nr:hypothetical protein [Streptomyces sp. V4I23]
MLVVAARGRGVVGASRAGVGHLDRDDAPVQREKHSEVRVPMLSGVAGQFTDDEQHGVRVVAGYRPLGQYGGGEAPDVADPTFLGRKRDDCVPWRSLPRGGLAEQGIR